MTFFVVAIFCLLTYSFTNCTPFSRDTVPSCHAASRLKGGYNLTNSDGFERIVVVGDIHGAFSGLKEVLYNAGVVSVASGDTCVWKNQPSRTLVVQMGDVVDRGPKTYEAFNCLEKLQESAPSGSQVVRFNQ